MSKPQPAFVLAFVLLAGCSTAEVARATAPESMRGWVPESAPAAAPAATLADDGDEGPGVGHTLLLYIPNRVFDLLDVVRLRLRVGPGLQVSVRATEFADLRVGGYTSIFLGIPGPRREPEINWPFGMENSAGVEVSVLEANADPSGPDYGLWEFGLGAQLFLVGADVGVDPWEALDFLAGLFTWDIEGDDL
jgi:hypothetical protein